MMVTDNIEQILAHYSAIRKQGIDLKTTLDRLQPVIEALSRTDKVELSRRLRSLENEVKTATSSVRSSNSKALDPEETIEYPAINPERVSCANCGKTNKKGEVVCYACGQLLTKVKARLQTQVLHQTAPLAPDDDFFGEDSVLVFTARHARKDYAIRPQDCEGELVVGRRTRRSPLNPDIDLADADGNRLGVSRLHLSIRYDQQYNTVTIFDLGSANGTFVNGQRLHPHEVRVLRHSDELRLGHMLLLVAFQHTPRPS